MYRVIIQSNAIHVITFNVFLEILVCSLVGLDYFITYVRYFYVNIKFFLRRQRNVQIFHSLYEFHGP